MREAARQMRERRVKRLPVVDNDGHLIGIVSRADVLSIFGRTDAEICERVTAIVADEFGLGPDVARPTVTSAS